MHLCSVSGRLCGLCRMALCYLQFVCVQDAVRVNTSMQAQHFVCGSLRRIVGMSFCVDVWQRVASSVQ
jgi:hypothetical protein